MEIAIQRLNETMGKRDEMVNEILSLHIPRLSDKQWDKLENKLNSLSYASLLKRYNESIKINKPNNLKKQDYGTY